MEKIIWVDYALCTGCETCRLVCSYNKEGIFWPSLARIKLWREKDQGQVYPLTCKQCASPPCADACLMNIITKDPVSGVNIRETEMCIGCRACQAACPFDAGVYHLQQDIVVSCDTCQGEPVCVKFCPHQALAFTDLDEMKRKKQKKRAEQSIVV